MRKMLMAFIILSLSAGFALADTYIGMFAEPHAINCYGNTSAYATTTVHYVVWVDVDFTGQISAAEFYIDNYPESGTLGIVTENWATPLKIGTAGYGIALAFPDPLQGPLAYLGSVDFFPTDPAWLPADYTMVIRPSRSSDTLAIVDELGIVFPVGGGQFTFNCSTPGSCDCLETVAVDETSWSSVKSLY